MFNNELTFKLIKTQDISTILGKSLKEADFFSRQSLSQLKRLGLGKMEAIILLASYKSKYKYGYEISSKTLSHILSLFCHINQVDILDNLPESPFFIMKTGWLYDHIPSFLSYNETKNETLDAYIVKFAYAYKQFIDKKTATDKWRRNKAPQHVLESTFWETDTFDPLILIRNALRKNIEGIELCIDFHPFNYTNLLPEEISKEKRQEIKDVCKRLDFKIDIHSPIVGPYSPYPNPVQGSQLFFDPIRCLVIQRETINLAKDIGAGCVVLHLIDPTKIEQWVDLISLAGGSPLRVTIENYYLTGYPQNADIFLSFMDEIANALPSEIRKNNFGLTLDVGHLNIEGEDPLIASEKIGRWCRDKKIYLRMHATDNYGKLLFSPPTYSSDIHSNVSGRGINNVAIIKLLRSMGHNFNVVAEQIQPLSVNDMAIIHKAQVSPLERSFEELVQKGREMIIQKTIEDPLIPDLIKEDAYLFIVGLQGIGALREHIVFRKIQSKKYLSVEEAQKISLCFMRMPQKFRIDLIDYMDDLLIPIQSDSEVLPQNKIDLICQNISGALFATLNNEHLNQIFSETVTFNKGETIFAQDSIGEEIFFIKKGGAKVYINKCLVAKLGPGEIFGELSIFYHIKRTATIKASVDKTKIGILSRNGFENLLRTNKPYTRALIYRLYAILPERLRNLNDQYKTAVASLHNFLGKEKKQKTKIGDIQTMLTIETSLITLLSHKDALQVFSEVKHFKKGDIIFREGEKGNNAYYILEGKVKALTVAAGNKIILGEFNKDDLFGELTLIDEKPRSESIMAVTPSTIGVISKKVFDELIETSSDLSFRLMSFICLSMFKRILRIDEAYADLKKRFD